MNNNYFLFALLFLFPFLQVYAQAASAEETNPLETGNFVPDVNVKNLESKEEALHKILSDMPTVLVFYRGGWCPYCNKQLSGLQNMLTDINNKGYQLVALSTDQPSKADETLKEKKLGFELYSDNNMDAAKAFGIAFKVSKSTFEKYKNDLGHDLEEESGKEHHLLPVPSVFVIKDNIIRYAYSNPDYKVRLDNDSLLKVLDLVNDQDYPTYPINNPLEKDVGSIDGIINAFYETISGPHYKQRNWIRLDALCSRDVQFNVVVSEGNGNSTIQGGGLKNYIDYFEQVFSGHNFYEKEIGRKTEQFDNMAHVFSAYELKISFSNKDMTITNKGTKSFQLAYEDGRWWIVNVLWNAETKNTKVPEKYINKQ